MKRTPTDEPLTCLKCGNDSVTIYVTADGARGETASYGAQCSAGCGMILDDLPSNGNGRRSSAIAEYKRLVKQGFVPRPPRESRFSRHSHKVQEPAVVPTALQKSGIRAASSKATGPARPDEWLRGYFCAVAALLREEGASTSSVASLFRQGGDWRKAAPFDVELFEQHGLITREGLRTCNLTAGQEGTLELSGRRTDDELATGLAIGAIEAAGLGSFTVNSTLSIDRPETLAGFAVLKGMLLAAYRQGQRETNAICALEPKRETLT